MVTRAMGRPLAGHREVTSWGDMATLGSLNISLATDGVYICIHMAPLSFCDFEAGKYYVAARWCIVQRQAPPSNTCSDVLQ